MAQGPGDIQIEFPDFGKLRRAGGNLPLGKVAIVLVLLWAGLSSFFTVEPEELGVVLRFGEFQRTADPGLNFKLPFGVESVQRVPVQRQLKEEFGFRTVRAGVRSEYSQQGFESESLMLTGDLNIADVEWVVQYRIVDPYKFLFRVRGLRETFRAMSEAVMREVVGDRTVNEVLTVGRQEIENLTAVSLQELCDQYETGIRVDQVVLQNVNPPDPVKPSFNEVNQAQQEREQKINAAQSEYNREVPRARGEAQQTIQQAEGYAVERVKRAEGDAARFTAVYGQYRLAPEVTERRLYLETMATILPQAGKKLVIDEDASGILPLLNLDQGGSRGGDGG